MSVAAAPAPGPLPPPAARPVAAVLSASRRRSHLRKEGLSDAQLIRHGRGAESLRISLFDATIPVGFTPLCTPPLPVRKSRPCSPICVQPVAGAGGSFVFARAAHRDGAPDPPSADSSASLLAAFLPLSIPPHLTPVGPLSPAPSAGSWAPPPPSWTPPALDQPANDWTFMTSPPPLPPCFDPIQRPTPSSWAQPDLDGGPTCYFDPSHHPATAPDRPKRPSTKTRRSTQRRKAQGRQPPENAEESDHSMEKENASSFADLIVGCDPS